MEDAHRKSHNKQIFIQNLDASLAAHISDETPADQIRPPSTRTLIIDLSRNDADIIMGIKKKRGLVSGVAGAGSFRG